MNSPAYFMNAKIKKILKKIEKMDADRLHDYLVLEGYTSESVAKSDPILRAKIYDIFDNDPNKRAEIARLMDNPNS